MESEVPHHLTSANLATATILPAHVFVTKIPQACCDREQIMVSKFVFPDGIEGAVAGGSAAVEGQGGEGDKKKKECARREEGGSEAASQIGSNIR